MTTTSHQTEPAIPPLPRAWRSRRASKKYSKDDKAEAYTAYLFMSPWLLGTLLFLVIPLGFSIYLSFTDWNFSSSNPNWVGTANYERMLTDDYRFWLSLKITGIYLLISLPVYTVVGLLGALLNVKVRGIAAFRTLLFLPSVLSGVAVAVLWIQLLNPETGVLNTILRNLGVENPPSWFLDPNWAVPAMVLTNSWAVIGGGAIIYLAGLQNIDPALYESASIDGAGFMRRFFSITLPMLTPTLFFQLITTVIASFQIFDTAFTVSRGSGDNLLYYLVFMWQVAFRDGQLGYGAALSLVLFVIGVLVVLVLIRTSDRWVFDEHARKK